MKKIVIPILLFLLLISFTDIAWSQWQQCNKGLYCGVINDVAKRDNIMLACIQYNPYNMTNFGSGLMISYDYGLSWTQDNYFSSKMNFMPAFKDSLIFTEWGYLYSGGEGGVCSSSDSGRTWVSKNGFFTLANLLNGIYIVGNRIFVSTGNGICQSTDNGEGWSRFEATAKNLIRGMAFSTNGDTILGGFSTGVFVSTDSGNNWILKKNTLMNNDSLGFQIAYNNKIIFTTNYSGTGGLFVSTDLGDSWHQPNLLFNNNAIVRIFSYKASVFVIVLGMGIYRTDDGGNNWVEVNNGLDDYIPTCINYENDSLFVGTNGGGIYFSTNKGNNWVQKSSLNLNISSRSLFFVDSTVYAVLGYYDIFRLEDLSYSVFNSSDNGVSWRRDKYIQGQFITSRIKSGSNLFACSYGSFFLSTDNGISWMNKSKGIEAVYLSTVAVNGNKIFIDAPDSNCVYLSTDNGDNWLRKNNGLPKSTSSLFSNFEHMVVSGNNVIRASLENNNYFGIYLSSNDGNSWVKPTIQGFLTGPVTNLSSGSKYCAFGVKDGSQGGVYISSDNGFTWTQKSIKDFEQYINTVSTYGEYIVAGTEGGGIFISSNGGNSWLQKNNGLDDLNVLNIAFDGKRIFIGTSKGLYKFIPFINLLAPQPKASITGPTGVCEGFIGTYYDLFDSTMIYKWEVSGGSIIGPKNDTVIKVNWLGGGSNNFVKLIKTSKISELSDTAISPINVYFPKMKIYGDSIVCSDWIKDYSLYLPGTKIKWSVENGTITGDDADFSVRIHWDSLKSVGKLTAMFTAINGDCKDTIIQNVKLFKIPSPIPIIKGSFGVCPNNNYHYYVDKINGYSYKWHVIGGNILAEDTLSEVTIIWNNVSNSSIKVDVYLPNGCGGSDEQKIFVNGTGIEILGDFNPCNLDTFLYSSTIVSGVTKSWTVSTGTIIGSDTGDTVKILWGASSFLRKINLAILTVDGGCQNTINKSLGLPIIQSNLNISKISCNPRELKNQTINIPLILSGEHCLNKSYAPDSLSLTLKINKTMFFPLKTNDISFEDDNIWRNIYVNLKYTELYPGDTIINITGFVLLGDSISTPIIIDTVRWLDKTGKIIKANNIISYGQLILTGVANDYAGLRLLTRNSISLTDIYPNPARGNIAVIIESSDIYSGLNLIIYDDIGIKKQNNLIDVKMGLNIFNLTLSEDFKNGIYFCILKSSLGASNKSFLILR